MAIQTLCTGCGQKLSVADENAGKRARCPACGHIYTIPTTDTYATPGDAASTGAGYQPFSAGASDSQQPPEGSQYWMKAVDGPEYGPVDQPTLLRWFHEGRVGPGYQIRQSQYGNWQPADLFRPTFQTEPAYSEDTSANPYSPVDTSAGMYRYPKPDQGVLILVMGILGFVCCPIFGVVAWVMGHTALNDIQAGRVDPNSKGLVQAGYYIGIASVLLNLLCVGGSVVIQALTAVGGGM